MRKYLVVLQGTFSDTFPLTNVSECSWNVRTVEVLLRFGQRVLGLKEVTWQTLDRDREPETWTYSMYLKDTEKGGIYYFTFIFMDGIYKQPS